MANDEFANYPPETLIELGKLALKMARGKETRRSFIQDVKKVAPDYQLPGDQQVEDLRHELAEKQAAAEEKSRVDAVKQRLEAQRASLIEGTLIAGKKFDADAIKEIEEKIMPKYGISDYEGAAKIYLGDFRPPPPSATRSANWTFPDVPGLFDKPAETARDIAHQVIDEFNRGGRAA